MEIHVSTLDQRALIVVLARRQQEHKVTGNHNLGGGAEKYFGDDDSIKEAGKNERKFDILVKKFI